MGHLSSKKKKKKKKKKKRKEKTIIMVAMAKTIHYMLSVCLFVLRFYGPVNPMGSCRARLVYLTTRLLGRLSPLSS